MALFFTAIDLSKKEQMINPTTYKLIMKTIVVTIWLNLRTLPAQAQVPLTLSMFNSVDISLRQFPNSTPPPPDNGAPDDRSEGATRAV